MSITKRINFWDILLDLFLLAVAYYITMRWLPLTNQEPFEKYDEIFLFFIVCWIGGGFLCLRYRKEKEVLSVLIFRSVFSALLVTFYFLIILPFFQLIDLSGYSVYVLIIIPAITLFFEITMYAIRYTFRSIEPEPEVKDISAESLLNRISPLLFQFLEKSVPIQKDALNITDSTNVLSLFHLENKSHFLLLDRFNRVKDLNLFLAMINQKLFNKGFLVGSFETKNARKKRILASRSWGMNYIAYTYDYLNKRFFPSFYLTSSLFSMFYTKIDKVFSKTEMYGRLYCAGFEFVEDCKIEGTTWFVFRKTGKPKRYKETFTGALVGLNRIGKNGKIFTEYKLRTMYPYSEYLQKFMIQQNKLQEGGKIKRDIRVTRIGAICRRFWIDELPQFINLLKGDIKLVGVRPLSKQYFNLYSPELQQMRIRQKPGILPPFYADMPKTLDEIQQSEMRYLQRCEQKGVLKTDFYYLRLILNNILVKRARSK